MTNILLVSDDLRRAGAEKVVVTLAGAFLKLGNTVTILILQNQVEYDLPEGVGLEIYQGDSQEGSGVVKRIVCGLICPVSYWLLKGKRAAREFERYISDLEFRKGRFDRIYLHAAGAYGPFYRFNRDNLEICVHNNKSGQFLRGRYLAARRPCAKLVGRIYRDKNIVTVSEGVKTDLINNFEVGRAQVRVIPNPLDFDDIRAKAQCDAGELPRRYIVNVARMNRQKRQDLLIKAFAMLQTDHKLVFVGKEDGEIKRRLVDIARGHGVAERVIFLGLQENPYPIIKNADLLVLSSDFEGFGLVLVEAMSLGVPVVSTDCPSGPTEILADYRRQLVPVGDVAALASRMEGTLKNPYAIDLAKLEENYGVLGVARIYLEEPARERCLSGERRQILADRP